MAAAKAVRISYGIKMCLMVILTCSSHLMAQDNRFEVIHGTVSFHKEGRSETIYASDQAILRCDTFQLREKEKLKFVLPSESSTLLCEIGRDQAALIAGSLSANGTVFFIAPSGIVLSKTAVVKGHSWVFSTLVLDHHHFLTNNFHFEHSTLVPTASIEHKGVIAVEQDVVFLASSIEQEGEVSSQQGGVFYDSGEEASLIFQHQGLLLLKATAYRESSDAMKDVVHQMIAGQDGVKPCRLLKKEGRIWLAPHSEVTASQFQCEGQEVVIEGTCDIKGACEITGKTIAVKKELRSGSFEAKSGSIQLEAPLLATQQIKIEAEKITQMKGVTGEKGIFYEGKEIALAGSLTTHHFPIQLHADLYLTGTNHEIHTGYAHGGIHLKGSLNGVKGAKLHIQNGGSDVIFEGAIGTASAFESLIIASGGRVIFQDNIGNASHLGVNHVEITAKELCCLGSFYHMGSGNLNAPFILWESPLTKEMRAQRALTLQGIEMELSQGDQTCLCVEEGDLKISSGLIQNDTGPLSLQLSALKGTLCIPDVGAKTVSLTVEAKELIFQGGVDVHELQAVATSFIGYEHDVLHLPLLQAVSITLNCQEGGIGALEAPVYIQTRAPSYIGSQHVSYLKGSCSYQVPLLLETNIPPRLVFNEHSYCYHLLREGMIDQKKKSSLSPILPTKRKEDDLFCPQPLFFPRCIIHDGFRSFTTNQSLS
ncbi:MAG: filamentous hemagglutinin N-terminal domain-containing protein [Candidatus Rhabdochlamydia sp.]